MGEAYRAWLRGDPDAKGRFARLVRRLNERVEPGVRADADICVPAASHTATAWTRTAALGTLLFDADRGKILSWWPRGRERQWDDGLEDASSPLLFEAYEDAPTAVYDGVAQRALPDLPGTPIVTAPTGRIVIFHGEHDDDEEAPSGAGAKARKDVVVARVWDPHAGRALAALTVPYAAELSPEREDRQTAFAISASGRYFAAVVIGSESHLVVWETATGRRLLSRPYYEPGPLVARFADDESALYAIPGERESIDSSLMRVSMPRGAVEVAPGCWRGPRFTTIELTADGRSATLSCWGGVAIFQAGPLRRTFRTPNLPRPRGPTYCGTFIPPVQTSFALGGRVVLIAEAMPFGHGAVAIRRVRDNAVLMRGTLPESPEDATTWLTSDTRVAVLLDSPSGPRLFDMRSNGSRTRNLTPDEAAFTVVPPELVEMPSAAAPPDAPSARAALDAQVCHAGELVIPREMCP